jgi:predicted nucleic acid-binding protein
VVAWVDAQPCDDLFISAITMAEILHGIERLPTGKRKDQLHVIAQALFDEDFADRVLPFDAHTAPRYAVWVNQSSLRQVRQPGRCANSRYLYCTSGKPRDTQR